MQRYFRATYTATWAIYGWVRPVEQKYLDCNNSILDLQVISGIGLQKVKLWPASMQIYPKPNIKAYTRSRFPNLLFKMPTKQKLTSYGPSNKITQITNINTFLCCLLSSQNILCKFQHLRIFFLLFINNPRISSVSSKLWPHGPSVALLQLRAPKFLSLPPRRPLGPLWETLH